MYLRAVYLCERFQEERMTIVYSKYLQFRLTLDYSKNVERIATVQSFQSKMISTQDLVKVLDRPLTDF